MKKKRARMDSLLFYVDHLLYNLIIQFLRDKSKPRGHW